MGGGRNNDAQANASFAEQQATQAAQMRIAEQQNKNSQAVYDMFFGKNGSGGTITPFMNPEALNDANLNPFYSNMYREGVNTASQTAQNAQRGLIREAANRGLGLSQPATMEMARRTALDTSRMKGQAYTDTLGAQHNEALSNFWGAHNIAAGQRATDTQGQTSNMSSAGQTNANVYGTAGNWHQGAGAQIAGAAIGAGGQIGAAAVKCPTGLCKIRVERDRQADAAVLDIGRPIMQHAGYGEIKQIPKAQIARVCIVKAHNGMQTKVATKHAFELVSGGFTYAEDALNKYVKTVDGSAFIKEVIDAGEEFVFPLEVGGDNSYLCDGFWSLA